MGLSVVKRNQRLMVVDEAGRIIYSPPDFLRNFVRDRREYQAIIDDMRDGRSMIDAILAFERMLSMRMYRRMAHRNAGLARMIRFEGD